MVNDDVVGTATVNLEDIYMRKKASNWVDLEYKGKKAGSVLIDMEFFAKENTSKPSNPSGMHSIPVVTPQISNMMGQGI